jgi:anti-sigma factor RsiW
MKCKEYQGQLEEWLDGALGRKAHAELERHLSTCAACTHYADQRRRLGTILKKRLHELTADLHFRPQELTGRTPWLHANPRALTALAAAALVALLFLFRPWSGPRRETTAVTAPTEVITVCDSLHDVDESFISGRIDGITYHIHMQVSTVRMNDQA